MPLFSYIAIDKEGKQKEGTLEVGSQNEAISRIKEMGFYPTQVAELKDSPEESKKRRGRLVLLSPPLALKSYVNLRGNWLF